IAVRGQGIKEPLFVETCRQAQIFGISGDTVQIAEYLAHATVFHKEHALHLLLAERIAPASHPLRHLLRSLERLLVTSKSVHVEMPRHDLVNRVEGGPNIDCIAQSVKIFLWERTEITIFVLRLTSRQFSNHQIAVVLQLFVARTGKRQSARG